MQGQHLQHTCFRTLIQVTSSGDFAVPGEAGILGLIAYNSADVLSAMKLSMHLLEMSKTEQQTERYLDSIRRQMDSLELLIGISRQFAVTPESIIQEMQIANLNQILNSLMIRLYDESNVIYLEGNYDEPVLILANIPVLYETLLTLINYCRRSCETGSALSIQLDVAQGYIQIRIYGEALYLNPNLFNQAVVCVCEGPHGHCTLKTPRSFQQNLEELTLANAQRIIGLHNGMSSVRQVDGYLAEMFIELPLLDS